MTSIERHGHNWQPPLATEKRDIEGIAAAPPHSAMLPHITPLPHPRTLALLRLEHAGVEDVWVQHQRRLLLLLHPPRVVEHGLQACHHLAAQLREGV